MIRGSQPVRCSLDETFDLRLDTGTPIVEDYVNKLPFRFTGTSKQLVINLGESGLGFNDGKTLKKLADNAARAVE